jgi:hypothetical protein
MEGKEINQAMMLEFLVPVGDPESKLLSETSQPL